MLKLRFYSIFLFYKFYQSEQSVWFIDFIGAIHDTSVGWSQFIKRGEMIKTRNSKGYLGNLKDILKEIL